MKIKELLNYCVDNNASDLHLSPKEPPVFRFDGRLALYEGAKEFSAEEVEEMIMEILNEDQKKNLAEDREIDFSYSLGETGRFRVNIYYQNGTLAGAFRFLPAKIKTIKELKLPEQLSMLTKAKQGLVLVVGPTGHGKTTTVASMVEEINTTRPEHIITIEDPIEYIFTPKKCLINQREVNDDTKTFPRALRSALRQDPDVIFVGEMRDLETISSAITLAETGHLVLSTLHTNNASQTIDRMIDVFPPYQQKQIRFQLAQTLLAVVSQRLLPKIGGDRVVAVEILMSTPAVRNLIREEKAYQLENVMQTGETEGMMMLEKSLVEMIDKKIIKEKDALLYANNKKYLKLLLNKDKKK